MKTPFRIVLLAAAALLGACGGGGGSTLPPPATMPVVALSVSNAKPVAAHALWTAQDLSATQGAALVTGVQIQAARAPRQGGLLVAGALQSLLPLVQAVPALPTGIAISYSSACPLGGSLSITGDVATAGVLAAGDTLTLSATSCSVSADGGTETLSGTLSVSVVAGSMASSYPYEIVLDTRSTALSITSGGITVTADGDARIDVQAASSLQQTLTASGSAMRNRTVVGAVAQTTTLRAYQQTLAVTAVTLANSITATVESDSPLLGPAGGTYQIHTLVPMTWDFGTSALTAGSVQVTGAANALLLLTLAADGGASVQLDLDANDIYETSLPSSVDELQSLQ